MRLAPVVSALRLVPFLETPRGVLVAFDGGERVLAEQLGFGKEVLGAFRGLPKLLSVHSLGVAADRAAGSRPVSRCNMSCVVLWCADGDVPTVRRVERPSTGRGPSCLAPGAGPVRHRPAAV